MKSLTPKKNLIDQAYETILDAVLDGSFRPGERLTQEDIAARLNVSRQPVMQALALLKKQGFLADSGRRGLKVSAIDPAYFDTIYQYRAAIEPLAVRLATQRLKRDDIRRGQALIEEGKQKAAAGDAKGSLQADMDWHNFLYEVSGNSIVQDTMLMHWRHMRRGMAQALSPPARPVASWEEHARIFEAMIAGDAERAADLMLDHLSHAHDWLRPST